MNMFGAIEYIGCYKNSRSGNWMQLMSMDELNSPILCEFVCADRAFKMFRLDRSQCWCVMERKYSKRKEDEKKCDLKCSGDSSFSCGSQINQASSLYKVTIAGRF